MKILGIQFVLVISCVSVLCGQPAIQTAGTHALGQTIALTKDVDALFGNPAGLAYVKNFSILASTERRFMLSEMQSTGLGLVLPFASGNFGFGIQNFGFELYRQQRYSLSYGRTFGNILSAGLRLEYLHLRLREYGSGGSFIWDAGLMVAIGKELNIAFHVVNPSMHEGKTDELWPAVFRLGMDWIPNEKTRLLLELEKVIDFPLRIKLGMEYRLAESVFVRAGSATNPTNFQVGLAVPLAKKIRADFTCAYHMVLGFTPAATLFWKK